MIRDAIQYYKKCWVTDPRSELDKFVHRRPNLPDFWEHCQNSHWMLWLLLEIHYAQGDEGKMDKLLSFLRHIAEGRIKRNHPANEHGSRLNHLDETITQLKSQMKRGNVIVGLIRTWLVALQEVHDAETDATIQACFSAPSTTEEEVNRLVCSAQAVARSDVLKKQADVLRRILGNPFR